MFTSYAQNFEDVILWRALKHVENGLYIDVGAQDPVLDSVSLGFYEKGWRGVHVEASADYAAKLRLARPDEEVVELALDRQEGEIIFYEIAATGLSTGDKAIADKHAAEGQHVEQKSIKSIPLSQVLDRYAHRDVHWLKIDVEGMEEAAIDGWLPSAVRPWVVAVESTLPNTRELCHYDWEPKLLELGYDFVYFDGLNRFYVSQARPELKSAFGLAPNIFDEFVLAPTSGFAAETGAESRANIVLRQVLTTEIAARTALEEEVTLQHEILAEIGNQPTLERHLLEDAELNKSYQQSKRLLTEQREYDHDADSRQIFGEAVAATSGVRCAKCDTQAVERNHLYAQVAHLENQMKALGHAHAVRLNEVWLESVALRGQLSDVIQSSSWRITKPLRVLSHYIQRIDNMRLPRLRFRYSVITWVRGNPGLKRVAIGFLNRFPVLDGHVRSLFNQVKANHSGDDDRVSYLPAAAPRRSRRTRDLMQRANAKKTN